MILGILWPVSKTFFFPPYICLEGRYNVLGGGRALVADEPDQDLRPATWAVFTVLSHSFLFETGVITPPPRTVARL